MVGFPFLSVLMGIPTVVSGLTMIFMEKDLSTKWIDTSMLLWVLMNLGWILFEEMEMTYALEASKAMFFLSLICLGMAKYHSDGWHEVAAKFRRIRRLSKT